MNVSSTINSLHVILSYFYVLSYLLLRILCKNVNYIVSKTIVFYYSIADYSKTMVSTVSIAMNPVKNLHFQEEQ